MPLDEFCNEDGCYELPLEDNDEDDENNGDVGWEF